MLLAVFWMGWLGMLVGAVLIIIQAPRCRDLPPTNWWNDGPLYQVGDVKAFSEDLKGEFGSEETPRRRLLAFMLAAFSSC